MHEQTSQVVADRDWLFSIAGDAVYVKVMNENSFGLVQVKQFDDFIQRFVVSRQ